MNFQAMPVLLISIGARLRANLVACPLGRTRMPRLTAKYAQ